MVLSEAGGEGHWIKLDPWPGQKKAAEAMQANRLVVCLKARQVGLSWLAVAFALWLLLFRPIATVLLFSRRDEEAVDLLTVRLKGMYDHLPDFLRLHNDRGLDDNDHSWQLTNGSRAMAFPTSGGDSYTATLAIIDEADLVPKFSKLYKAVKPTIDGGGRMILISRPNKADDKSQFKQIFKAAHEGRNAWKAIFLPWNARPDRTPEWYEKEKKDTWENTGSLDDLHENYPATVSEALAPKTQDKRIPARWLQNCYRPLEGMTAESNPAVPNVPGLTVYKLPERGASYVAGGDPAKGNPNSNDSAAEWFNSETGEQVAELSGKIEMSIFGDYIGRICEWFNDAPAMIEENSMGTTVIKHLQENFPHIRLLEGHKKGRIGWISSPLGKVLLYNLTADAFRQSEILLHSLKAYSQLAAIDGSTLLAPNNENDDIADACALAIAGRSQSALIEYSA